MKHTAVKIKKRLFCIVTLGAALGLVSALQPAFAQSEGVSREEFLKVVGEMQKQNRELAQEIRELKKEKAGRESALTQRIQQLEQKQQADNATSVVQLKQEVDQMMAQWKTERLAVESCAQRGRALAPPSLVEPVLESMRKAEETVAGVVRDLSATGGAANKAGGG